MIFTLVHVGGFVVPVDNATSSTAISPCQVVPVEPTNLNWTVEPVYEAKLTDAESQEFPWLPDWVQTSVHEVPFVLACSFKPPIPVAPYIWYLKVKVAVDAPLKL